MTAYLDDDFEPDRAIGYLTKRIHQDARALMEPLFADADVSYTEWAALVSVHFGAGATCAALARDIGHDMGATSRMLATLEGRGLIARERSGEDRRVVHLALSARGLELAIGYRQRLIDQWNLWLADWPKDEVEALIGQLQRLRGTLETARGAAA